MQKSRFLQTCSSFTSSQVPKLCPQKKHKPQIETGLVGSLESSSTLGVVQGLTFLAFLVSIQPLSAFFLTKQHYLQTSGILQWFFHVLPTCNWNDNEAMRFIL